MKKILLGFIVVFGLIGCQEEPEYLPFIYKNYVYINDYEFGPFKKECIIEFYNTEYDWLTRQNPVVVGKTDTSVFVHESDDPGEYWIYVESEDSLNNYRHAFLYPETTSGYKSEMHDVQPSRNPQYRPTTHVKNNVWLTRTPTKLGIKVLNNGNPVEGAHIKLYFSQEAYEQELFANCDSLEKKESYGGDGACELDSQEFFSGITDPKGYLLLTNLEPKQYWFRITKDGLSNENGTIKLDEPLPDDIHITTSITVGIN